MIGQTNPLQLIKDPIVLASRQLKPVYLAANVHPPNLPMNARTQIATVNAHIVPNERISISHPSVVIVQRALPVFSKPRSVERPESVKYWRPSVYASNNKGEKLTNGRNITVTISSSFSVRAIARPPSRGTMTPARNAPVHDVRSKT